jgi:glyoxylase-like metal-dependent hydrolase (beta-lactamase superfamily II)
MKRERVTDDVYIFTSERYAQVTASLILTSEGAVLIDTLAFPDETREIKRFVETRLNQSIHTLVYTHHHADHTLGGALFPEARLIAHARCFDLMMERGEQALTIAKQNNGVEFSGLELALPREVFDLPIFEFEVGKRIFQCWHTPGHSMDSIVCLLRDERILFAGDTLMPIPYFVDGSHPHYLRTLESLRGCGFESAIQGHGEMILRGEIEQKLAEDLAYLRTLQQVVDQAQLEADPARYLAEMDIERCGKSRLPLAGQVAVLHQANLRALMRQSTTPRAAYTHD